MVASIDKVMASAERFRRSIKTSPRNFIPEIGKIRYMDYLKHQIENPTRANIAMNKMYKKYPVDFPLSYEMNMAKLENIPEVDTLVKTLENKYGSLYPKTGELRNRLIRADRIVFEEVKPALKGFKKQLLKLRVLF